MYSRSMVPPPYRRMGYKEPSYRQSVRIPPNYSGIAIGDPPPDGVSPATDGIALAEPPLSDAPLETEREETTAQHPSEEDRPKAEPLKTEPPKTEPPKTADTSSVFKSFLGQGFPFGHGLGYEELLLLGLILFLLRESEEKGEESDLSLTLLLLGALLFCG